jgi:GNAT superfamily N-acetyltransferase
MAGDVQIEQFELADQDALLSFLRVAYADEPRKSEPAFWRWHYLENPLTPPDDIPLWVVRSGKRIVGQLATIPVELKVGGDQTRAIWILDFVILPEYRGRGLGKRLVLAARESFPTMITLGINEQSTAVFRSLKWVALGGVHRYHRLLYPGDALSEVSKFEPLRRLANLCYAPFRPRDARTSDRAGGVVREITTFDGSFADLWQRASAQWTCAVVRSPRYLEWQFARQPGKKFDVLGLYEHERLVGYVVLFFRKDGRGKVSPKVAISDICYDASGSPQVIDDLLRAALRLALERRAGSLVTDVLDPTVEARLRHAGFWRIKAAPQFMASASEHQDLIYQGSNWFLTRGDSDVSIFEQPNL